MSQEFSNTMRELHYCDRYTQDQCRIYEELNKEINREANLRYKDNRMVLEAIEGMKRTLAFVVVLGVVILLATMITWVV